jgi:hypothetical protein
MAQARPVRAASMMENTDHHVRGQRTKSGITMRALDAASDSIMPQIANVINAPQPISSASVSLVVSIYSTFGAFALRAADK